VTESLVRFGRAICGDWHQAKQYEWYLSNAMGGYASGTLAGCLTRRYHGLLINPLNQVLDRHLLWAKADATLWLDGQAFPLFSNAWSEHTIEPSGYVNIESFHLDGRLPVWHFAIQGVRLEYRIWMSRSQALSWVGVKLLDKGNAKELKLTWDLLINYRDHHSQMNHDGFMVDTKRIQPQQLQIAYNEQQQLVLGCCGGEIQPESQWIKNFYLEAEQQRGLASYDNHLKIAKATVVLINKDDRWLGVYGGLEAPEYDDIQLSLSYAQQYQKHLLHNKDENAPHAINPRAINALILAADDFIFKRILPDGREGYSIIAGYPWFGDWGRDTMIALPGLTLGIGKTDMAWDILRSYALFIDRGMLPNMFPETDAEARYNTVDAALWYIVATYHTYRSQANKTQLQHLFSALASIITHYTQGTRYGIKLDNDGLLMAGENKEQLTWMDAKIGDWVVTPRHGKPVEVNALWYNALNMMAFFAEQLDEPKKQVRYQKLAQHCYQGMQRFVRSKEGLEGGLYDVLDGPQGNDASIRPNQLFALSLPWLCIEPDQAEQVLSEIKQHLLTSYGLRSLAPSDSAYQPIYQGGVQSRDSAYHQGTVWGWLLGHFAMADYQLHHNQSQALSYLSPLFDHLQDAGLGSLSEIFDAAPPHHARGTPLQAWTVACTLQAWQHIHNKVLIG